MKKVLRSVVGATLASAMVFSMFGCSKKDSTEPTETSASESTEATTETTEDEGWTMPTVVSTISSEGNIIKNGNFEDADTSMWSIECGSM